MAETCVSLNKIEKRRKLVCSGAPYSRRALTIKAQVLHFTDSIETRSSVYMLMDSCWVHYIPGRVRCLS